MSAGVACAAGLLVGLLLWVLWSMLAVAARLDDDDEQTRGIRRS